MLGVRLPAGLEGAMTRTRWLFDSEVTWKARATRPGVARRNVVCKIFDVETVRVALQPSQVVGRRPRLDGEAAIELRHAPPRRRVDGRSSPGMWRERVGWHRRQEVGAAAVVF